MESDYLDSIIKDHLSSHAEAPNKSKTEELDLVLDEYELKVIESLREMRKIHVHQGEPKLYTKLSELIKLSHIYLNHAPKHEKFGICQNIRQSLYATYELVVESQKKYHKKTTLTNLDIEHEKVKMLYKLFFDLGYFKYKNNKRELSDKEMLRRYKAISILLNETGAMIGGWIKYNDAKVAKRN